MSLATPEKIRTLQRKLYRKAKAEPVFRFYVLYDKICREDILRQAYGLARANAGAPGVDGVTFAQIEERGPETWLAGLREDLVSKTYRPDPVRRVLIPKPDGGERPLGIPTIRDRVVQTAAKLVLEPIFEADFEGQRLRLPSRSRGGGRGQGSAPAHLPGLYRCGRRRPLQVLRYDPACRADALCCPADRGS
jgi:RNA-directed DNA polymerase